MQQDFLRTLMIRDFLTLFSNGDQYVVKITGRDVRQRRDDGRRHATVIKLNWSNSRQPADYDLVQGKRHYIQATLRLALLLRHQILDVCLQCRMTNVSELVPPLSAKLTLAKAANEYLERRKPHLTPRSFEAYQYHFRTLQAFYGTQKQLSSFHEQD